ncbi:lytic murein transglycosylase [[Clostridium] sordellii]|uniref:transglycosylase SLT domain-containing protein n=1 Tax=Paraclostridium sordellii TaxID=1505 RepID=UPI0005E885CF|nr:transglycosylase SLT domain-containing protein [Paeniclostridium sordellii]CEN76820.1 lytic murein transglycosylase [[Clostridium] sordellii] [Paeniclostridium sordellii]
MKKIIYITIGIIILLVGGAFFTARTLIYPVKYTSDIKSIAKEYNLDPYLLAALGHFESRFNDKKYEKNSNNGIFRFSDQSATKLAKELNINNFKPENIVDEKTSLKLGAYYVSKHNDKNLDKTIQEWNVKNGEDDKFDRREYAHKYYLPKIEQNMKIFKVLYPELNM